MAMLQRLVLFVEGEGDRLAVPVLVKHLLTGLSAWDSVFLDPEPFVVDNVAAVTAQDAKNWLRWLHAAGKRRTLGAVLLLLDGDLGRMRGEDFCAARFGDRLAQRAREAGGGQRFSVACVFACQEYESWALAYIEHLAGKSFPDGRPGIRAGTRAPDGDLELSPRDVRGWLNRCIEDGYKPTRDQEALTRLLIEHLDVLRLRPLRSFRRLESALRQLVDALRSAKHVVTPRSPSRPPSAT